MINPIHTHLNIQICNDVNEAIERGFVYNKSDTKPISVKNVVVVQRGTYGRAPTVDFLLEDENGQRFVFMVTGALLKSIPC